MNRMNRVIGLGLALAMCFSLFSSAYAVEEKNQNVISFEDYYQALKAEYAKYNVNLEILDHDDSFVYTKELLDEEIASLNSYMKTADFDANTGRFINHVDCKAHASENNIEGQSLLRSMPYTRNWYTYVTLRAPSPVPGSAEMEGAVNATENIQNNTFMYINKVSSRQYGNALNFESWTQTSNSLRIYHSTEIWGWIFGTIVFVVNEPKTGTVYRNTSDQAIEVSCEL